MRALLLVGLALFVSAPASGQGAPETGDCAPGAAEAVLENAGVRARLFNTGRLFWTPGLPSDSARYEVPRGGGVDAAFVMSLWLAGLADPDGDGLGDPSTDLRFSGSTYANAEYWPGPLAPDGDPPSATDCEAADRIWRVTLADIARYNATGEATADLAEWPAHLGAPVVDGDGVAGNYDLAGGDRPALLGDETAWWVMNDRGGSHGYSGKPPLGVEVRVTAFSVSEAYARVRLGLRPAEAEHVHHATFYRYAVSRRGGEPLTGAYVGFFVDGDLGDYSDDFVGSYPESDLVYFYNSDDMDGEAGTDEPQEDGGLGVEEEPPPRSYGASPPAAGMRFTRERGELGLSAMVPRFLGFEPTGNTGTPRPALEGYRMLRGTWPDGVPLTVGGDGYNPGSDNVTRIAFSGVPPYFWSESSRGDRFSIPGDRGAIASSGPFSLPSDTTFTVDVAYLWARSPQGHLASVYRLIHEAAPASVLVPFEPDPELATIRPADLPRLPEVVTPETVPERARLAASAWPSPASAATAVRYDLAAEADVWLDVIDALGRVVAVLAEGTVPAGEHRAAVDVSGWAPGAYVYRLRLNGRLAGTGRLVVAR